MDRGFSRLWWVLSYWSMSNVEFSEEKAYNASLEKVTQKAAREVKGLNRIPIALGLAKDETGATVVLSGMGVLAFILGVIIFLTA